MGWWATISLTAVIAAASAFSALLTAAGAVIYNRAQMRMSTRRLADEAEIRRVTDRAADTAAQTAAQTAMAAVSEKLAQTSFQYVDRLQIEMDRMRTQYAGEAQAAIATITELQLKVAALREELAVLRLQLFEATGVQFRT